MEELGLSFFKKRGRELEEENGGFVFFDENEMFWLGWLLFVLFLVNYFSSLDFVWF